MSKELRVHELMTLKTIAETLNRSNDLKSMLQSVLEELLDITGLTTGWIFLVEDPPEFTPVADHNLPPALTWGDKKPMCTGSCWCLDRFWDGRLKQAVNIIHCKRLEDAVEQQWGDTRGITRHATVPLTAGGELFGILNVASPGKEHFSEDELTLLQSVAYQIGTAVKRTWLYEAQQKRADNYAKLNEISPMIWKIRGVGDLPGQLVRALGETFHWPVIACFLREGRRLKLHSVYDRGRYRVPGETYPIDSLQEISTALMEQRVTVRREGSGSLEGVLPPCPVSAAVPLSIREERIGVLYIGGKHRRDLDDSDLDVLKSVAKHVSLALESARLDERRRQLVISEERNRLARDLHDSVNQKLFSLSLTARGAKEIAREENELLKESLNDIQTLSQDALREMRTLIWQLRPPGLEEGVVTALKQYGEQLGLRVSDSVEGVRDLPQGVEEALWRIGQEALNNVKKHAKTDRVFIRLRSGAEDVRMDISDEGCGFVYDPEINGKWSLGISSMKERAELIGGSVQVSSTPGKGTTVRVRFPLGRGRMKHGD